MKNSTGSGASDHDADQELTSCKYIPTPTHNDGGQWDMVVFLEKYGVVPKSVYPDSFHLAVAVS